jgi:hypothetical protein
VPGSQSVLDALDLTLMENIESGAGSCFLDVALVREAQVQGSF